MDGVYRAAAADRLADRHAEAIEGSRRVLAVRPDDVDARLNLALALIATDRLDEAERELAIVLAQAPDYADARAARDRIARLRAERAAWRLDVLLGRSELSRGLHPWHETAATLSRRTAGGTIAGTVEQSERFGRDDTYVEARVDRVVGGGGVYGAIGGAPDADFRPEIAVRAGGQMPIGARGFAATVDAGLARYVVGTVTTVQPGIEYATSNGELTLGGRWINVWDERDTYRSGYALRALWTIRPSLRLRGGYADAPESSDGVTVDVRSTTLGLEADVSERLTVRLNGLREERAAYDRDEITLGLGVRF